MTALPSSNASSPSTTTTPTTSQPDTAGQSEGWSPPGLKKHGGMPPGLAKKMGGSEGGPGSAGKGKGKGAAGGTAPSTTGEAPATSSQNSTEAANRPRMTIALTMIRRAPEQQPTAPVADPMTPQPMGTTPLTTTPQPLTTDRIGDSPVGRVSFSMGIFRHSFTG
jgi:hypothetical protein